MIKEEEVKKFLNKEVKIKVSGYTILVKITAIWPEEGIRCILLKTAMVPFGYHPRLCGKGRKLILPFDQIEQIE